MMRLLSAARWDVRLQFRNGFYYVSLFTAVIFVVLLKQFDITAVSYWWPAIITINLTVNSFYFMAGLILLEKGEGTLEAQIVTPLRPWEILGSKVLTLGLLSLFETLIIIVIVQGVNFNWVFLVMGVVLYIAMLSLYGFIIVARYESINEFLLPSALWTMGFSLPLLYYFDIWRSWVMFLHPLQAVVILIQAAFRSVPVWQIVYGIVYAILWMGIIMWLSLRAFHRFVVTKEGVRRT
ncbi:ABC transporter permease [uncultured Chloroflexus sp.]|uniref:ABC transporter permease n=1 Tax=uncultured Chloroflexus sp. TaxID=214040 RepID=UPI00261DED93|nr:ABC transporter permease [uncultured Chloroflexus sp.]